MLAMLALLFAATGGSVMSLQYIFIICRHTPIELWIVKSGRSWEQDSVCGDDPSIQQNSHAAVYTLLHDFTFTLLSLIIFSAVCMTMYVILEWLSIASFLLSTCVCQHSLFYALSSEVLIKNILSYLDLIFLILWFWCLLLGKIYL